MPLNLNSFSFKHFALLLRSMYFSGRWKQEKIIHIPAWGYINILLSKPSRITAYGTLNLNNTRVNDAYPKNEDLKIVQNQLQQRQKSLSVNAGSIKRDSIFLQAFSCFLAIITVHVSAQCSSSYLNITLRWTFSFDHISYVPLDRMFYQRVEYMTLVW